MHCTHIHSNRHRHTHTHSHTDTDTDTDIQAHTYLELCRVDAKTHICGHQQTGHHGHGRIGRGVLEHQACETAHTKFITTQFLPRTGSGLLQMVHGRNWDSWWHCLMLNWLYGCNGCNGRKQLSRVTTRGPRHGSRSSGTRFAGSHPFTR
jgi:hypothetical protein